MNSIIRVACGVNQISSASPSACCENLLDLLKEISLDEPDIIIFPRLALCPPSGGSLNQNPAIASICEESLEEIIAASADFKISSCIFVGMILNIGGLPCEVTAVIQSGKAVGLLCGDEINIAPHCFHNGWKLLSYDTVFKCGDLSFCVCSGGTSALPNLLPKLANSGCNSIIIPSYEPVTVESSAKTSALLSTFSDIYGIGIIYCNGGVSDTSSPLLYEGNASIYECGTLLKSASNYNESFFITNDLDCDIINACRKIKKPCFPDIILPKETEVHKKALLRHVVPNPFLPESPEEADAYLDRLFALQVQSLVARIINTGLLHLVLGVSGGLDSTLALLVCHEALVQLELPANNLVTITMPGFGTSDQTYFNALSLIENLGGINRDISIKTSVLQHFEDIGHSSSLHDITYENAQARERTQILFDVANACRGLVVGTGDLSEAALGWCTFNGDHMASYNVNICITKTVIRKLVTRLALKPDNTISHILHDIVDTPVSPELLPPDSSGQIKQKTEDILGSYDLHDFFLYYLLRYNFKPQKILYYANTAFADRFSNKEILEKLRLFLSRFFAGQFKRSCSPDSASITEVNLSSWKMPSDCSPESFLSQLR